MRQRKASLFRQSLPHLSVIRQWPDLENLNVTLSVRPEILKKQIVTTAQTLSPSSADDLHWRDSHIRLPRLSCRTLKTCAHVSHKMVHRTWLWSLAKRDFVDALFAMGAQNANIRQASFPEVFIPMPSVPKFQAADYCIYSPFEESLRLLFV